MKIYTKKGDMGETGLYGGARVPKDHLRIQAYGTLDELNAVFGLVLAEDDLPKKSHQTYLRLQGELFQLGAELATPAEKEVKSSLIGEEHVKTLENEIDEMETELTPLKTFILPGGTRSAAQVHFARTVSRRAERELITLHHLEPVRPLVLQFINRLSDFLFVSARYLNHVQKIQDTPWFSK